MKKKKRRLHHYVGIRHEEDPAKISEMLAPVEEQEGKADAQTGSTGSNGGAIIVDSNSVNISSDLSDEPNSEGLIFGLHPVVIAIVIGALLFISFITWQISLMPRPEK